jgi:hypothetical protein
VYTRLVKLFYAFLDVVKDDDVPPPPHIPLGIPNVDSSSQTAPPPQQDACYS